MLMSSSDQAIAGKLKASSSSAWNKVVVSNSGSTAAGNKQVSVSRNCSRAAVAGHEGIMFGCCGVVKGCADVSEFYVGFLPIHQDRWFYDERRRRRPRTPQKGTLFCHESTHGIGGLWLADVRTRTKRTQKRGTNFEGNVGLVRNDIDINPRNYSRNETEKLSNW